MGRAPCCSKVGLHRGPWTSTEDSLLATYIQVHGEGQWRSLPTNAGLLRCGKSCRLRWMNYLRPDIKRGDISRDEDDLIIRMHALLGNRWSLIAGRLPGRTDNEIKNYWNTHLSKQLWRQGTDPKTHKKISDLDQSPPPKPKCKPRPKKKKPTTTATTTKKEVPVPIPVNPVILHQPKAIRAKSLLVDSLSSPSLSLSLTRNSSFESTLTTAFPPYDLGASMATYDDQRVGFLIGEDYEGDVEPSSSDLAKLYNEYYQLIEPSQARARELDLFAESLLI